MPRKSTAQASEATPTPRPRAAKTAPPPAAPAGEEKYILRLYIAGQTRKSITAFNNLQKLCEKYLKGNYEIEVIDLLEQPQLAKGHQILAIPTLVREIPTPLRKIIGDLSDTERVLVGLDLVHKKSDT